MDTSHDISHVEIAWEPEEKYRTLFEAIDEGFCIVEVLYDQHHEPADYRFIEVNPVFEKQTGLVNAAGRRMRELAPLHEQFWFEIYSRIALTGKPERFEHQAAALNRWYDVYAFRVGPPEHHRVGILFNDITQRRDTEDALRRSEERLRRALAIGTIGVIFFGEGDRIVDANDAFLRMSGYSRDDLKAGRVQWEIMTPSEWMPASLKAINEFRVLGKTTPYEKQYIRKDGSRWWALFAATKLSDDEGVEFVIDISESKNAEHSLTEIRSELQRTNKSLEAVVEERTVKLREVIAELHQVSYAMVHDMRAPLRAMRGFAELLEKIHDESAPPQAREYCRRIVLAAERLDNLIADALNYTKVLGEELPVTRVDLQRLIKGIVETYPNLHAEHADISIESLPMVLGNESLLTQLFSNLLGNAVKFVAPGVRPQIRIWSEEDSAHAGDEQPQVRVWVEDNGLGIPKGAQERVFRIFQRFHAEYPGTGIGLAIVKKAAERMGGSVGMESEEGKGSRFWVELPTALINAP